MLEVSHNPGLVILSLAVSLLAAFTGLSLTKGAQAMAPGRRKVVVGAAAVALGGGIWAMHFVAMLGLRLPIFFYYDPLVTLISALVAILVAGTALLILHFAPRNRLNLTLAGAILGLGIALMHYIGMSGMELCRPVYTLTGIAEAVAASLVLGIAAVHLSYGSRRHLNILLGTLCFGVAVFAVHFIAMSGTGFVAMPGAGATGPQIDNDSLALIVTLVSFVICGAFLLSASTFFGQLPEHTGEAEEVPAPEQSPEAAPAPDSVLIPYERSGQTGFVPAEQVAAIRAEGHYTFLYTATDRHFCTWSISRARERLPETTFIQTHRSYLINPSFVTGFERRKDNGVCLFENTPALGKVPVSRGRLQAVREALGL
ncbi:MAG: MHYT domain-containing protein [Pseudomonadota bacterium]